MKITESHTFIFEVEAKDRSEAVKILLGELVPESEAGVAAATNAPASAVPAVPDEVFETRIASLLASLGAPGLTGPALNIQIQKWTKLGYTPANYPAIILKLEAVLTGQAELPHGKET